MKNPPRTKETSLWGWLKVAADKLKKRAHVQRIESDTGKGIPDVEGCFDEKTFWCELKVDYPMANDRRRVKITGPQARWARKRCRAGGNAWVLVRSDGFTRAETSHHLIWGLDALKLLEPIAYKDLVQLSHVPEKATALEILQKMREKV